jgi:hypothetical protein
MEKEMSQKSEMTREMKLNLVGNSKEPVIAVKRKDTLLETVPNELTIHNVMVIKVKVEDLLAVLKRRVRKIMLMKKHYIQLIMKI